MHANFEPYVTLVCNGWAAMVEETVMSWVPAQQVAKRELLDVLTAALPAVLGITEHRA